MAENSLIHETSPYLLQHAHNPVKWYSWNETALKKARDENKPIFLSIGYSSCHWCHVMAHESFENKDIATIMNENFINIKVDREERPDIDDIYQKTCQIATGQGGWPLSVFLTPDQKPFYVGTYFPPLDSYGRPGFGSILRQLSQAWKEKPQDVQKAAENFLSTLQKTEQITTPAKLEKSILDEAAINLIQIGDPVFGGFGSAPKFPNSANLSFLLRYYKISG
ncbi:MAG: thioredoxin domain-containing protein, partial [Thaumarchaeota archaeon]|nr:thioredoxin domain-containing protein [Nitrososphaerota archaeon]